MPDLSAHVTVADTVVEELNHGDRSWSSRFQAVRSWLPVYEPAELDILRVSVVALTIELEQLDRGRDRNLFGLVIDFQQRVNPTDRDQIDALDRLAQDVQDFLADNHRLTGSTDWEIAGVQRRVVYDLDQLYEEHTWETMLEVEIRGARP